MIAKSIPTSSHKPTFYLALLDQLRAMFDGERDWLANSANVAAMLGGALPDINWAGFYFYRGGELVVGPFFGKPACVRIALSRGVCGAAASTRKTIVVPDVHKFPGHIACDSASNSEIVVPMVIENRLTNSRLIGVLDVDSPLFARFDVDDQSGLEAIALEFVNACDWPAW